MNCSTPVSFILFKIINDYTDTLGQLCWTILTPGHCWTYDKGSVAFKYGWYMYKVRPERSFERSFMYHKSEQNERR